MLKTPKRVGLGVLLLLLTIGATTAIALVASTKGRSAPEALTPPVGQTKALQKLRNTSVQPEARKLSRLLGNRFLPDARSTVTTAGTLTIGTISQSVTVARRQTEGGETVEILSGTRTLKWNPVDGTTATVGVPTLDDSVLINRLVFDGPEEFVLGQLRGASYQTVARNVRPEDAASDYNGPLWTIIRVNESQQYEKLEPVSSWRLYYLNTDTGLIDRIVSQMNGETVEATILSWNEQNGQRMPSHIIWSVAGRTVMDYRLTNITVNE